MAITDFNDLTTREKKAGQKAARTIRRNLKLELASLKDTGLQLQTAGASVHMKFDELNHIAIKATPATFIQHFGFEGIKSNGARMSLKPYNHFDKVLTKGNVLDKLINEIGDIKGEEITRNIRF